MSKHQHIEFRKLKFEILMRVKIPENGGKSISIFCAGHSQCDSIYSMTLDFVSWSVYWQLTSLFTSCIGQLWNLARLNESLFTSHIGQL